MPPRAAPPQAGPPWPAGHSAVAQPAGHRRWRAEPPVL